ELQTQAVHQHGGFVDKFMGDGLMAFWPKETTWKECCEKAFKAALVFKKGLPLSLLPGDTSTLDLRIGLHCGNAIFGNFGAHGMVSQTFLGSDVNLAARCEQAKESSEGSDLSHYRIRASEAFWKRLPSKYQSELPQLVNARVKHNEVIKLHCRSR
ncbi:MAG: adenylate/guanylate cyclase domain-containing protein, partial [Alphaproteobacteria bacterium]|nr:adenylate/guanylate cyclase domain-containing protein [Alphaproteobacteria bacterium]